MRLNREIYLKSKVQLETINSLCESILKSGKEHRVIITPADKDKTLRQLGGLFGVWISHLEDQTGFDATWMHVYLKKKFLFHIYFQDPKTIIQQMWVDGVVLYRKLYSIEPTEENENLLNNHKSRISLSWATCKQTRAYMEAIDRHFTQIEIFLPILKKYADSYKK